MENPNNFDPDTFGGSDLTPPKNNNPNKIKGVLGGLGNFFGSAFENVDDIAGVFSSDYQNYQLQLAQTQGEAYANALALQNGQKRNQPNYTLYIAIAVVVLLAIYLLTRRSNEYFR